MSNRPAKARSDRNETGVGLQTRFEVLEVRWLQKAGGAALRYGWTFSGTSVSDIDLYHGQPSAAAKQHGHQVTGAMNWTSMMNTY